MDDYKSIEDILEELKKENFIEELTEKLFEKKIKPYIDEKTQEIKDNTKKYAKKELSTKEKVGKMLLAANGLASFKYSLDYVLSGMYLMAENFPRRPIEMYIDLLVGAALGFWCYMSFHRSLTNHWL